MPPFASPLLSKEPMFFLMKVFTIAVSVAFAQERVTDGQDACMVRQDVTSLIQTKRVLALGSQRPEVVVKKLADQVKEHDDERQSSRHGRFEYLKSDPINGACFLEGVWTHGQGPPVRFQAQPLQVMLGIQGLPTMVLQHHEKLAHVSSFELDGVPALMHQTLISPKQFRDISLNETVSMGFASILRSPFASAGAKSLSSLLGLKGYHGSKSTCSYRLHMFLLSLAKAAKKDNAKAILTASTLERKWVPYGRDQECPTYGDTTWKCRNTLLDGDTGPWFIPPDGPGGPDDLNHWIKGDVKCEPQDAYGGQACVDGSAECKWEVRECIGLCGAGCDCWESLCGPSYKCDYNPMCCAHDLDCSCGDDPCPPSDTPASPGAMTNLLCANSMPVLDACKAPGDHGLYKKGPAVSPFSGTRYWPGDPSQDRFIKKPSGSRVLKGDDIRAYRPGK